MASRNILRTPAKQPHVNSFDDSFLADEPSVARRRRRISITSSIASSIASTSTQGVTRASSLKDKENDRFIPHPTNSPMPLIITPRTKRLAKQIGTSKGTFLRFQDKKRSSSSLSQKLTISPTKKKTLSIMRHCTTALNKPDTSSKSASARYHLSPSAVAVLDAPSLYDDYYSRPVDWSSTDHIACAMARTLNIRHMGTHKVTVLDTAPHSGVYAVPETSTYRSITNIRYSPCKPSEIAVGLESGHIQAWDIVKAAPFFKFRGYTYIGGLSWRLPTADVLSAALQSGMVKHFDPRCDTNNPIWDHLAHTTRVTALEWNEDGRSIVTCGVEEGVKLWDARMRMQIPMAYMELSLEERFFLKNKDATMKGLAWCPWQPHLFATGGGTQDGMIRIYSTRSNQIVSTIETNSQISSLHWSKHTTELLSTHGYSWSPSTQFRAPRSVSIMVHEMDKATSSLSLVAKTLDGTHGRISHSCLNPSRMILLTAGSDQTVKLWKVFGEPVSRSRKQSVLKEQTNFR